MVGDKMMITPFFRVTGFEPMTFCSQNRYATKLRHTLPSIILIHKNLLLRVLSQWIPMEWLVKKNYKELPAGVTLITYGEKAKELFFSGTCGTCGTLLSMPEKGRKGLLFAFFLPSDPLCYPFFGIR